MDGVANRGRRPTRRVVFACVVTTVLGIVAWPFLVWVFPTWMGIQTFCFLATPSSTADTFATLVTLALIACGLGLIVFFVNRADHLTKGWLLMPIGCIGALLALEGVARLIIGRQDCTGGIGIF